MSHEAVAEVQDITTTPKAWGGEVCFVNNDKYCGKLLKFKAGKKFSMHFHADKDETWYVLSGKAEATIINTTDASNDVYDLVPGVSLRIRPFTPHQILATEDTVIVEVSTPHRDDDSYRVAPGDSQCACDTSEEV